MAGTKIGPSRAGAVEVAAGIVLSAGFLLLAIVASPVVAITVVTPFSLGFGLWRAHTMVRPSPHSLSVPVFQPAVVIRAPRVSAASDGDGITTAA